MYETAKGELAGEKRGAASERTTATTFGINDEWLLDRCTTVKYRERERERGKMVEGGVGSMGSGRPKRVGEMWGGWRVEIAEKLSRRREGERGEEARERGKPRKKETVKTSKLLVGLVVFLGRRRPSFLGGHTEWAPVICEEPLVPHQGGRPTSINIKNRHRNLATIKANVAMRI